MPFLNSTKNSTNKSLYLILLINCVFFIHSKYTIASAFILASVLIYLGFILKWRIKVPGLVIPLIAIIAISISHEIISPSQYQNSTITYKEILRYSLYIFIILIISNITIEKKFSIKAWLAIFLITFMIALLQYLKILNIGEILETIYGESIHFEISTKYTDLGNFRAGSIFSNFNNYAQFITIILLLYFATSSKPDLKAKSMWLAVFSAALVLTGSRSGFLVSAIYLTIILTYQLHKSGKAPIKGKFIISFVLTTCFFLFMLSGLGGAGELRLFSINSGLSDSLGVKYANLAYILDQFKFHNALFGLGAYDINDQALPASDSDLGYLITYYGLIGIAIYLSLFIYFIKYAKTYNNEHKILTYVLLGCMVLFGITGGVFFNFRIFPIYLIILLTRYETTANENNHAKSAFRLN